MLLHAQDIWPDFIQILSKPDGFMVQLKLKTSVISFITELFTDSETKHGKELLELLTVLRTLILLFHGIELDTWGKETITDTELLIIWIMDTNQDISSIMISDKSSLQSFQSWRLIPKSKLLLKLIRLIYYAHIGITINVFPVMVIIMLITTEDVKKSKMNVNSGESADHAINVLGDGKLTTKLESVLLAEIDLFSMIYFIKRIFIVIFIF